MKVDIILEAGLPPERVETLAAMAEGYGVQTLWVACFPSRRDPLPALALCTRNTRRIRLATVPTSPYEVHPLRMADTLLTLNEMSGGRATILVGGLGHSVSRVTGLAPTRRVTAVGDCVKILKSLRPDAETNYKGDMFSLLNYRAEWATAPAPRVYAGATFEKMMRMATACADGTMMSDAPLTRMPQLMEWINAGLAVAGRGREGFAVNNFMAWHVKRDPERAQAEARQELIWRGLLMPWFTETFLDAKDAAFVEASRPAFLKAFFTRTSVIEGVPEPIISKLVENMTLTGGPQDMDHIAAHLHALEKAGLDEVALRLHADPEEGLTLIGERLMPALG